MSCRTSTAYQEMFSFPFVCIPFHFVSFDSNRVVWSIGWQWKRNYGQEHRISWEMETGNTQNGRENSKKSKSLYEKELAEQKKKIKREKNAYWYDLWIRIWIWIIHWHSYNLIHTTLNTLHTAHSGFHFRFNFFSFWYDEEYCVSDKYRTCCLELHGLISFPYFCFSIFSCFSLFFIMENNYEFRNWY